MYDISDPRTFQDCQDLQGNDGCSELLHCMLVNESNWIFKTPVTHYNTILQAAVTTFSEHTINSTLNWDLSCLCTFFVIFTSKICAP